MKISDSAVSPLSTWLAHGEATPEQVMRAGSGAGMAESSSIALPRQAQADQAEGLLRLDVWGGDASPQRTLSAQAQLSLQDPAALEATVEHIFSPLC